MDTVVKRTSQLSSLKRLGLLFLRDFQLNKRPLLLVAAVVVALQLVYKHLPMIWGQPFSGILSDSSTTNSATLLTTYMGLLWLPKVILYIYFFVLLNREINMPKPFNYLLLPADRWEKILVILLRGFLLLLYAFVIPLLSLGLLVVLHPETDWLTGFDLFSSEGWRLIFEGNGSVELSATVNLSLASTLFLATLSLLTFTYFKTIFRAITASFLLGIGGLVGIILLIQNRIEYEYATAVIITLYRVLYFISFLFFVGWIWMFCRKEVR